jgi:hypothetical protein
VGNPDVATTVWSSRFRDIHELMEYECTDAQLGMVLAKPEAFTTISIFETLHVALKDCRLMSEL